MSVKSPYIHIEKRLSIFRFSFYRLGNGKVTVRFEISWGWD